MTGPKPLSAQRRAGRPTAVRAAQIDGMIRNAARRLFLEAGADATSMDAVASAAGVSKGTLYSRFANKEELLRAVIADLLRLMDKRASATDHLLPDALGPRLREHARKLVEAMGWTEYSQFNRLILSMPKAGQDGFGGQTVDIMRGYIQMIAAEMAKFTDLPHPERVDWTALAHIFLYSVTGWHRDAVATGQFTQADFEHHCGCVVDTILAAASMRHG